MFEGHDFWFPFDVAAAFGDPLSKAVAAGLCHSFCMHDLFEMNEAIIECSVRQCRRCGLGRSQDSLAASLHLC